VVARGNPENSGLSKDGKVRCKDCINKKNIEEAQEELIIFKNYVFFVTQGQMMMKRSTTMGSYFPHYHYGYYGHYHPHYHYGYYGHYYHGHGYIHAGKTVMTPHGIYHKGVTASAY